MSQFYARYVPPSTSSAVSVEAVGTNRKRPARNEKGPKESKKRKTIQQNGEEVLAKYSSSKTSLLGDENVSIGKKKEKRTRATTTASRASNEAGAEQSIATTVESGDNEKADHLLSSAAQLEAVTERSESSKKTLRNGDQQLIRSELPSRESPDLNAKHAKVLSRFRSNAVEVDEQFRATATEETLQALTYHDLEPIPQPKSSLPKVVASYATAPEWLRQPIQVDPKPAGSSFKDLGIQKAFLQNLEEQAITAALPVQSTVLPLVLNKDVHQRHDLCVAAATGSGKTLAYVLPILNDLRNRSRVRLRSVIVVPTRALVKQVVQTIESCSTGIDLRVGTAEGSKTLDDERAQLVEETQELDLHEWQRQQDAPINWSTFSLEETVKQATNKNMMAKVGYVTHFHSRIDILICTPGRLVEHLQTTQGFNLDDVDWFVADEADKLLNESYHEWLEIVLPALKSQQATKQRDDLLRSMYMEVPPRRITKILLSATMTKDISQLLLLDLTDPKLVVMASDSALTEDEPDRDMIVLENQAEFRVPNQLHETAVAFKDSENKPLYLLHLLQEHILSQTGNEDTKKHKPRTSDIGRQTYADNTSSSGSSDSDNESDSSTASSASDSESESDATSISSFTSSSSDSTAAQIDNNDTRTASVPSVHPRVLIFTKSTESAHRLSRLLALLQPTLAPQIATFTRSSSSTKASSIHKTRSKILQSFSTGKTPLLICTDLAARGLDIPSLEHVINYDVPSSALTYIHRVGRTARAGREGQAWTLVEHKQGKWFWETIGGKARSGVEEIGVEPKVIGRGEKIVQKLNVVIDQDKWMDRYEEALAKLGEDVRAG